MTERLTEWCRVALAALAAAWLLGLLCCLYHLGRVAEGRTAARAAILRETRP